MKEVRTMEQWEYVRSQSENEPVLLLKHSSTCPVSAAGYQVFNKYNTDIPKYYLVVQRSRPVSREVEGALSVQHESPQLLLLKEGEAVWHASHYDINQMNIKAAVEAHR